MHLAPAKKKLLLLDPKLSDIFSCIQLIELTPTHKDPYEALISSIAHQMVHGNAAKACLERLQSKTRQQTRSRDSLSDNRQQTTANYEPKAIVRGGIDMLRACGFSTNKSRAILELAEKKLAGTLPSKEDLAHMSDVDIIKTLVPLRGIGKWTVEMYLIFSLGRLDVFPVDDFGVREGYRIWKKKKTQEKPAALAKRARRWAPYRTVVALALWKLADTQNKYKK